MTEYELSTELVFWGDALDCKRLADDLRLVVTQTRTKGEVLKKPDGTDSGSRAKTGMLSCECSSRDSVLRRDPQKQLLVAVEALRRLAGGLRDSYGVAEVEVQISMYYKDRVTGEPDFIVPPELLELIVKHGIELRITALP